MSESMSDHLTPEERVIRERCAAASGGPWMVNQIRMVVDWSGCNIAAVLDPIGMRDGHACNVGDGNAAFIAASRQDVPTLLDTIEQLRGEVERLREALRVVMKTTGGTAYHVAEDALEDVRHE
jgi:hypothetical protein